MSGHTPKVSIGLPVYNGEKYLASAIHSLLAQTFTDYELIISDNASTDKTAEICQWYADRDPRIRYLRLENNIGAPENFNRTFREARGEYFRWHAHDDMCAPEFLERCVEVLDRDPSVVLAYSRTAVIDYFGNALEDDPGTWKPIEQSSTKVSDGADRRGVNSSCAATRLRGVLMDTIWCYEMFGLIRRKVMAKTDLHRNHGAAGKVFVAEMALQGRFEEVGEILFYNRRHAEQFTMSPTASVQNHWAKPNSRRKWLPIPHHARCTLEYASSIARASLPFRERISCYGVLLRYIFQIRKWSGIAWNAVRGVGISGGYLTSPDLENSPPRPQRPPAQSVSPDSELRVFEELSNSDRPAAANSLSRV